MRRRSILLKSSHPTIFTASQMQQVASVEDDLVGIFCHVEVAANDA